MEDTKNTLNSKDIHSESLQEVIGIVLDVMENLNLEGYTLEVEPIFNVSGPIEPPGNSEDILILNSGKDVLVFFRRFKSNGRVTCKYMGNDGHFHKVADPSSIDYEEGIKRAFKNAMEVEMDRKLGLN